MRTTLEIDDDVLQAAKEIAASRGSTAGKVLSELARRGLQPSTATRSAGPFAVLLVPDLTFTSNSAVRKGKEL